MQTCSSSLARPGAPTPRTLAVSLRLFEDNRGAAPHGQIRHGKTHDEILTIVRTSGTTDSGVYRSLRRLSHEVEATVGGRDPAVEPGETYLQRVAEAPCENFREE